LLKGCEIAQEYGNKALQVFGDSKFLIKTVNSKEHFANPTLNKTLQRLRCFLQSFVSFDFYHILHNSNKEADKRQMRDATCHNEYPERMMRHLSSIPFHKNKFQFYVIERKD